MLEKRQTPFRYESDLDEDIEILKNINSWGTKAKNKAIINAIKIASAVIKEVKSSKEFEKAKKEAGYYYDVKSFIEGKFKIRLIY